jgi:hypothetical protein
MVFQVTQVGTLEPLWPYVLALHVNPSSLQEQFTKNKNVAMTRGGFVEFVWPDDLDSLSADSTTGAFIGPDSGLTSDGANPNYMIRRGAPSTRSFRGRHGTIAWERHTDLLELFRSNGQIFSGGVPVLRSQIMCMYDRGIYTGWFTTFEIVETGDTPFQFKVSWEFKVTRVVYKVPGVPEDEPVFEQVSNPITPGNNQETRDQEILAEENQSYNPNLDKFGLKTGDGVTNWNASDQLIGTNSTNNTNSIVVDPDVLAAMKPVSSPSSESSQQSSTSNTSSRTSTP